MTNEIRNSIENDLDNIINYYNSEMEKLFSETNGGTVRGAKGRLVEKLAKDLVLLT